MKRFALFALPLFFAAAQLPLAAEEEPAADVARPVIRGRAQAPQTGPRMAPQPRPQRNLPAMQPSQSFRGSPDVPRPRREFNPGGNVQPRVRSQIYTERGDRGERQRRIFNPNTVPITAPAPVEQPQPAAPPVTTESGTRDWTRGGRRSDTGGSWTGAGGIEGNQDWRNRRGDGDGNNGWRNRDRDGDGNSDWRARRGDGRRGNWRYDETRRRQWSEHRLHRRNEWSRHRRNRSWWTSRYNRFALFGGGYYYWNSGYWYPAYGYDPYFSTYTYDAPIYSYNDQDPGQVIANVQQALQQQGYYEGELDGSFGPLTRQALLAYQRDNGLPVTGEIDQDTLGALGFE